MRVKRGNIIYDSKFNDPKQMKYSLVEEAFIKLTNKQNEYIFIC